MPLVLEEIRACVAGSEDVESTFDAEEPGNSIRKFVDDLPAREGDVFVRRYFFVEPVQVIAQTYGLTENHVSVTLNRLRAQLRRCLTERGFDL